MALYLKAIVLVEYPKLFLKINNPQTRSELAIEILNDLHARKSCMRYQAKVFLGKHFPKRRQSKKEQTSTEQDIEKLRFLEAKLGGFCAYPEETNRFCLAELENLVRSKKDIQSLYEFYVLIKGVHGNFLRVPVHIGAGESVNNWQMALVMLQQQAAVLRQQLHFPLSKTEEENLAEIWAAMHMYHEEENATSDQLVNSFKS
jgi:hypothetical protein